MRALLLAFAAGPAFACPIDGAKLAGGGVQAAWQVAGAPAGALPAVGRHFALELRVCPADAVLERVDAVMPEHRHGMNYRPSLKALGDGRWRAEGLMFHMPGRWELRLDVAKDGRTERLRESVVLP